MAYQVYTEEMLSALEQDDAEGVDDLIAEYAALTAKIFHAAERHFDIRHGEPSWDLGRGAASISPRRQGQGLPEVLREIDDHAEWIEAGGSI